MAFNQFTFPQVQESLGLSVAQAELFAEVAIASVREEFAATIRVGTDLALAINTEKARSELIIAPVLLELWRMLGGTFGFFSGIEFDVDSARGLNGVCDFILTKLPQQMILTAPLVSIVEAKNDNIRFGLGQCIAAMVGVQEFNQKAGVTIEVVFGVVTTGSAWKFMQLQAAKVTFDIHEYFIVDLGRIMGILTQIVKSQ